MPLKRHKDHPQITIDAKCINKTDLYITKSVRCSLKTTAFDQLNIPRIELLLV